VPNFIKIGQTVAEIWRFNGFLKWRPSAILDFGNSNFSTVWVVKIPILHNRAKIRKDRPIRCCNIAIFVIFKDGCRRHLGFRKIENFYNMPPVGGQSASACQISSKSVKRLQRYDDLTVFFAKWRPSPSWICWACIGTTRGDYLVVCIVALNLV